MRRTHCWGLWPLSESIRLSKKMEEVEKRFAKNRDIRCKGFNLNITFRILLKISQMLRNAQTEKILKYLALKGSKKFAAPSAPQNDPYPP